MGKYFAEIILSPHSLYPSFSLCISLCIECVGERVSYFDRFNSPRYQISFGCLGWCWLGSFWTHSNSFSLILIQSGSISSCRGHYGSSSLRLIRIHLGSFGIILIQSGSISLFLAHWGIIQAYSSAVEFIRIHLSPFGFVWFHSRSIGFTRANFASFGLISRHSGSFRVIRANFASFGLIYPRSGSFGCTEIETAHYYLVSEFK